jgi:hypothetical protein
MDTTSCFDQSVEVADINLEMGTKFAIAQVIQSLASAGMIPVPSNISVNLETHIDDTILDPDNFDAFYGLHDALEISIKI